MIHVHLSLRLFVFLEEEKRIKERKVCARSYGDDLLTVRLLFSDDFFMSIFSLVVSKLKRGFLLWGLGGTDQDHPQFLLPLLCR
jgi:hypothetical protein